MNPTPSWHDELQALCEAVIEDRLTETQQHRLEELVLGDAEARRFYVAYMHLHAALRWSVADAAVLSPRLPVIPIEAAPAPAPLPRQRQRFSPRRFGLLAASLAMAVLAGWLIRARPDAAIATLSECHACKWEGGSLPTEAGARLGAGRLRLGEGLAKIVFAHGAELTLEGPAELELISAERCVLHAGRLVAHVPPPAHGFVVDTPTASLRDLGTEFGVTVRDAGAADVQVFDGTVDVRHRASGATQRLLTGRNVRFGADAVNDFDPHAEKPLQPQLPPRTSGKSGRVVDISTSLGRGKDTYVQPLHPSMHDSDILLLVKNTVEKFSDYHRKAYIGIDLTPIAGQKVVEASLSFAFAPTGMGFAAEVPDATFGVYGLLDEKLDDWEEQTLRWKNAPANGPGGTGLDPKKVKRLGTFEIAQGVSNGTRDISGPALVDFLNRDTNGLATFILVRETPGSGRSDLVHGFASKRHPVLPPPTLRLTVAP